MAYATVSRIKMFRNHAEAERIYNETKPIRGSVDVRPIGERRDAHWYRITKNAATNTYEAILYQTPVVTFYPDNTIKVKTGGFNTATTMQFISNVLGINAWRTRGASMFTIGGESHAMKGSTSELMLKWEDGQLRVTKGQTHKQWAMSRTGANNVRAKVSEFRGYFKGFLSLRGETIQRWGREVDSVAIELKELVDLLGVTKKKGWRGEEMETLNVEAFYGLANKQQAEFQKKAEAFYELIRNDQPEETKTHNFYKAAVGYFAGYRSHIVLDSSISETLHFDYNDAMAGLDEIMFKLFSDEVFVLKDVAQGKAPSNKYDRWVGRVPEPGTLVIE